MGFSLEAWKQGWNVDQKIARPVDRTKNPEQDTRTLNPEMYSDPDPHTDSSADECKREYIERDVLKTEQSLTGGRNIDPR
jgi:hypothetical protein